jgi:hypothetical protein
VLDRAWRLAAGAAAAVVGSVTELAGAVCSGATSAIGLVRASVEEVANPIVPTLAAGDTIIHAHVEDLRRQGRPVRAVMRTQRQ